MKHFTVLLVAVLVFNSVAVAQATQTQGASQAAKVKAEVQKRSIGEKSRVKVRLRNKAEVKGYISKIEDASFDVTDKKTRTATTIPYADVEKVQGSGLSKGAKIGIIAGAAVVIVAVVIAVGVCRAGYC
jgi:RimP-like protein